MTITRMCRGARGDRVMAPSSHLGGANNMEFRFPTKSLVMRSLAVAFAFTVLASIAIAGYLGPLQHPAGTPGTETTYYFDKDRNVVGGEKDTYDKKGQLVQKEEFDKKGKVRKRTTYTYL